MGMNTHVFGIKKPDVKWQKMKAIYDACVDAGEEIPDNVDDYFNGEVPDDAGVLIDLEDEVCCVEWSDVGCGGFEIDISQLPKHVSIIRFFNSH